MIKETSYYFNFIWYICMTQLVLERLPHLHIFCYNIYIDIAFMDFFWGGRERDIVKDIMQMKNNMRRLY